MSKKTQKATVYVESTERHYNQLLNKKVLKAKINCQLAKKAVLRKAPTKKDFIELTKNSDNEIYPLLLAYGDSIQNYYKIAKIDTGLKIGNPEYNIPMLEWGKHENVYRLTMLLLSIYGK